jgi:hypothetical protein
MRPPHWMLRPANWPLIFVVVLGAILALKAGGAFAGIEGAKKIAQIRSEETLWHFLAELPVSVEAQIVYGYSLAGIAGSVGSFLWKWSQGMADRTHWSPRYFVGQILWIIGSGVGAVMTVGFTTDSGEFFGWLAVLTTGALAGFSGDLKVKERREPWTDDQRAAAREEKP